MVQTSTQVPKRALGKTGVQVSCIGMGCSPFGHAYGVSTLACRLRVDEKRKSDNVSNDESSSLQSPDEDAAMKAVDEAFKSGVNFFDVAPFYASGDAERVRNTPASSVFQQSAVSMPRIVPAITPRDLQCCSCRRLSAVCSCWVEQSSTCLEIK